MIRLEPKQLITDNYGNLFALSKTMTYAPPTHRLQVLQKIDFEEGLTADDPRYVETQTARGSEKTFIRLASKLGWDPASSQFFFPPMQKHILFFGHVGSGKSTELRHYAKKLHDSNKFLVIDVDVNSKLDRNNLEFPDTLMAMAEMLLTGLQQAAIPFNDQALQPLRDWFGIVVQSDTTSREYSAEIRTGLEAGGGLPGFIKLFAQVTSAFKTGSTTKTELRKEIRNTFGRLADAFNAVLASAEAALISAGRAERVLFLLDGTDKLRSEATKQFFVQDAEQLLAINALVIYTAPIHLKYDSNVVSGKLDADLILPMIKLFEPSGVRCEAGWLALRNLLLKRADHRLFASETEINTLIEHSGGHPRELLRLLKLSCEYAETNLIDSAVVTRAIKQLASEYRRFLEPADYPLLKSMDTGTTTHSGNDDAIKRLLYNLALLEYNDGSWRRSHPVIRGLDGYINASTT
ncbi:MAG: ATP-binding protein [Proteobacteria bacterium]|nr:ATP-binding protein [Pseudomonadota bacterium]